MHSDADTLVYDTIRAGVESSHGHGKFVNAKASKKGGPIFLMVVGIVQVAVERSGAPVSRNIIIF